MYRGYINPISLGILAKFFKRKKYWFSEVFKRVFKKSFLGFKLLIFIVFGLLENQRKLGFGILIWSCIFYLLQETSQLVFLCCLFSKTLWFHTWAIFYPKLLGSCFCGKREKEKRKGKREVFEVVCCKPLCCKHPFVCESLFGRGDRVIELYPSSVRW